MNVCEEPKCKIRPSHSCGCKGHASLICGTHISKHIARNPRFPHNITVISNVNFESKDLIIEKLQWIKQKTLQQISNLNDSTYQLISRIESEVREMIHEMNDYIDLCDSTMFKVTNLEDLPEKSFYTPIENLLKSEPMFTNKILNEWTYPTLTTNFQSDSFFKLQNSALCHLINEYNNCCSYIDNQTNIVSYDGNNEIIIEQLNSDAISIMVVSPSEILLTGGGSSLKECRVIKIDSLESTQLADLNIGRGNHSCAWIEGCPAVIGGFDREKGLKKVEIFENNKWKLISDLNIARNGCSSATVGNSAYVFGGYNEKSIEEYNGMQWKLLEVSLPSPRFYMGAVSLTSQTIMVLGGKLKTGGFSRCCYKINVGTLSISALPEMRDKVFFPFKSFLIKEGNLKGKVNVDESITDFNLIL